MIFVNRNSIIESHCASLYSKTADQKFLASATCLQKTGSETGFSAQKLDRLLDRIS